MNNVACLTAANFWELKIIIFYYDYDYDKNTG